MGDRNGKQRILKLVDELLRTRADFAPFLSEAIYKSQLEEYDMRISALEAAKAALIEGGPRKLSVYKIKKAHNLTNDYGWSHEKLMSEVEKFHLLNPNPKSKHPNVGRVFRSIGQVWDGLSLA